jgi:hypothetical protein
MTNATQTKSMTVAELIAHVATLEARIESLEASTLTKKQSQTTGKEMTDDDARRVLTGDLKDVKHGKAAEQLGLSYGQIYSCRLEFTFKAIHQEMAKAGVKNVWAK